MAKYIDYDGMIFFLSELFQTFVEQEAGKGLSANDFTNELKSKLDGLSNYTLPTASAETLGGIKVGAGLAILNGVLSASGGGTADAVDWSNVQNKPDTYTPSAHTHTVAQITDFLTEIAAYGYQTSSQVTSAINTAISSITGISFEIVASLPVTGQAGKIYLMSNTGSSNNIYDEYIYYNSKWERIGSTDVDLSGYLKTTDMTPITNEEIIAMFE